VWPLKRELRAALYCAALVPLLFAVFLSFARAEAITPLAPLLGPFAGRLFGHGECTYASVDPQWSTFAAVALACSLLASWKLHAHPRALLRRTSHVCLALAITQWCSLAALSVINTLS